MTTALVQLVSEQTMPNVLGALALRPARLVLLHTSHTRRQCDWIARALRHAGLNLDLQVVQLPDTPDHQSTGHTVREHIQIARADGLLPVVNFTGGTKLMSIGAFAAAYQDKAPSFYLDTEHRQIHAGSSIALPAPLDSSVVTFRAAAEALTVTIITAAHGIEHFKPGRAPEPWLEVARLLAASPPLEQATHEFTINVLDEGRRRPEDYHRLLETPLDDLPDPLIEPLAMHDHITLRDGHWHLSHANAGQFKRWAEGERYPSNDAYFAATAPLQSIIGFLAGGWWELTVLDAARDSGRFRDLHWSPQANRPNSVTPIEEDILAVEDLNLALISCKRGGERSRLLRAFEELDSAGRALGGTHTRRYLAVASALPGHYAAEIKTRGTANRTQLIGPCASHGKPLFSSHPTT